MTNIGIVHPQPGYHDALRELTRRHGTLLVIDETHTLCAGPGGYTAVAGLEPDAVVVGKAIGGGVPAGAYGLSQAFAERVTASTSVVDADVGGIGGTLAGNALSLAAVRATLAEVLTDEAFAHMIALGERFEADVARVIKGRLLPWHVSRVGSRVEYAFSPEPPRNGAQAAAAVDEDLDRYLHLFMLNRGILMTPFHDMALMSPATTREDVDRHAPLLDEAVAGLYG